MTFTPEPHPDYRLAANDKSGSDSVLTSMRTLPAQERNEDLHSMTLPSTTRGSHETTNDSALQEQTVVEHEDGTELEYKERYTTREPIGAQGLGTQATEHGVSAERECKETSSDLILDPLRICHPGDSKPTQELTADDDDHEGDLDTSKGYSSFEKKAGKRTSHLRLDIRPPSPQPWELVDPPTRYSSAPQKMRGFQGMNFGTTSTRPPIPKSSYYFGPPPSDAAFGTAPVGQIGVHHPREIIRIERDYTGGELTQFAPIYPLELEGRITPTHFLESINAINELLISAHSIRHSFLDNVLAIFTLQLSRLVWTSHYEKEMKHLERLIEELNSALYNPVGLNILWPRGVAFLFLEIEYY